MGSPRDFPIKAESSRTTAVMKGHSQAVTRVGDKVAACFFRLGFRITRRQNQKDAGLHPLSWINCPATEQG